MGAVKHAGSHASGSELLSTLDIIGNSVGYGRANTTQRFHWIGDNAGRA